MTGDEWLATVRIARDLGTTAQLLPDGIRDLNDVPYPLHSAISMALTFLGWEDDLPREERPPREIWLDNERLRAWFDQVRANRESGRRTDDWGHGDIEDPVENGWAQELKAKLNGR